jgi:hypothetical protein
MKKDTAGCNTKGRTGFSMKLEEEYTGNIKGKTGV